MAVSPAALDFRRCPAPVACAHCSLPVPPARRVEGAAEQFCCAGCEAVWQLLHECKLEEYYRLRAAYEERSSGPARVSGRNFEYLDDPDYLRRFGEARTAGGYRVRLYLEGVHCIACAWLVEKILLELERARFARLDLGKSVLELVFNPAEVKLSALARALDRIGYTPHPLTDEAGAAAQRRETRRLLARLGIAAAASMNIMLLAVSQYAGDSTGIEASYAALFRWVSLGLALPAVLYSAWPYYRGAWQGLKRRVLHMDLPISLGILAAFAFSTLATFQNQGHVYFDSVTALIALLLAGRLVLQRATRMAADAGESLLAQAPKVAHVLSDRDSQERDVPVTEVLPGNRVSVRPGEIVPVDGRLLSGAAHISEAHLSGESAPVERRQGDVIYAGSVVSGRPVVVEATATGETTRLARLAGMMRQASLRRAPVIALMDRIAGYFVAGVLLLAGVTAAVWAVIDPARILWNVAALLVVACPCALGLATPVALAVAMGRAARRGIFIKGQDGIERLASVEHVILDKTGTLTAGELHIVHRYLAPDLSPDVQASLHQTIAGLELNSGHILSVAFGYSAAKPESCRAIPGAGVEGTVAGADYVIGTASLLDQRGIALSPEFQRQAREWEAAGLTLVHVARDGREAALYAIGDTLHPDAATAVKGLRDLGLGVELLSGDHPQAVQHVAGQLGITEQRAATSPEEKLARVEHLLAAGQRVAMVGDGVNDAAALSRATVGISTAGAAEVARDAADVFIATTHGPAAVTDAFRLARRAMHVIRWNLALALLYNLVGVTLAITGHVGPLVAAVLMPLSSLTVLLIASRA